MISCNCSENYQNWIINFYGKYIVQLLNVVFGFHLKVMHGLHSVKNYEYSL